LLVSAKAAHTEPARPRQLAELRRVLVRCQDETDSELLPAGLNGPRFFGLIEFIHKIERFCDVAADFVCDFAIPVPAMVSSAFIIASSLGASTIPV